MASTILIDLSECSNDSFSDTDTDRSGSPAADMLLDFPEYDQVDIGSTNDDNEEEGHAQIDVDSANSDNEEEEMDLDLNESEICFSLPKTLDDLQKNLLGDYSCPKTPPANTSMPQKLTPSEMTTLQHYVAWKKSNGTVQAYKLHAQVLQNATGMDIQSLHSARKLAMNLTELKPSQVDMCPRSCLAYTGEFAELQSCPHVNNNGKTCGEPRYRVKTKSTTQNKPRAQMMYLPIIATLKAMFANAETSRQLRYRDKCLQEVLHLVATAPATMKYSDFCDSKVHIHHYKSLGLFQDSRDIAFALSTDGAQLTMKRQSDTWLLILMILNLPPEFRYKAEGVIYPFAIPGPNPPGNIESYLYPLFEDMAMANEGIWIWDAVDSSYFVHRACICMALGDMLGSAKLNGMAGHAAIYGDRFSMVKGARSSLKRGSKSQYYPIAPPENSTYNAGRPIYDLSKIPMRSEEFYWKTITNLQNATSKATQAAITKETGISRMPLCAASPAFLHPSFFPLDPFHLFYENCMAFIWDLWMTISLPNDPIHIPTEKARKFGQLVSAAMSTLPPSFCGPVRDPFLKRQSQYKIYEWMALLHWYILPIGIELEFNPVVLENFSHFVEAIEIAMTIAARSDEELSELHSLIQSFLMGFERIYIGNDPEKVSRFRLCIFQLIHVPIHIEWNGSIRLGSQATVERAIGEVGHKIRSKKAPFANLANIIFEKELVRDLLLYYPSLDLSTTHLSQTSLNTHTLRKEIKILKREQNTGQDFYHHLQAICLWLQKDLNFSLKLRRWGKLCIPGGAVLRSRLSETQGNYPSRSARYFEARKNDVAAPIFGEALAFFEVVEIQQVLVLYHSVSKMQQVLRRWRGVWSEDIEVLPASAICGIIGIWCHQKMVYILRKHPGLALLSTEECGNNDLDIGEEEE